MKTLLALTALTGLAALSACGPAGPNNIHSIGVTRDCGGAGSAWLEPSGGLPVRCQPQTQTPHS